MTLFALCGIEWACLLSSLCDGDSPVKFHRLACHQSRGRHADLHNVRHPF